MVRGIGDVLQTLGTFLPPWALALIVGGIAIVALPAWVTSIRIKQIRGDVRRLVRADDTGRSPLIERILSRAAHHPFRLEMTVREAIKYAQTDLRDRALQDLAETGRAPDVVRALREEIRPPPKVDGHPMQAVHAIERLLGEGMDQAARERLDRALARFPGHTELERLRERV